MRIACCLQSTCLLLLLLLLLQFCASFHEKSFCAINREMEMQRSVSHGGKISHQPPRLIEVRITYTYMYTLMHTHSHTQAHILSGCENWSDSCCWGEYYLYAGGVIYHGVHWLPHGLAAILAFETVRLQLNIKSGNLTFTAIATGTGTATVRLRPSTTSIGSGKFVSQGFCFYTQIESEISLLLHELLLLLLSLSTCCDFGNCWKRKALSVATTNNNSNISDKKRDLILSWKLWKYVGSFHFLLALLNHIKTGQRQLLSSIHLATICLLASRKNQS